ncbi:tyrosine-type recombinase/integrase [Albidovulum sediminis]|uniref:Tyrosine-type recombinase/integrase n=1 Tax=Albidovulum sediminis TaxID=3066345 RepID=A0ABT2NHS1_9RHOB|nr:tyrosine-type recombinase/integrase [Defluviimonas sediminis]MCT8328275.1 tyrosine-type recombinase/integrase [Defluviimonas sediminis]
MRKYPYLRSKRRRGRWFHTYRRGDREISLGVHGLHPTDPQVIAAWAAEHARWEFSPPDTPTPSPETFAWGVDIYKAGPHWPTLSAETRKNREAILRRYVRAQGARPLRTISTADIEAALSAKGGNAAANELKAIRPVFAHLAKIKFIPRDPTQGIAIERPKTKGHPTASSAEIAKFQERWPIGTRERLIFDLALYTGAARVDLASLGRRNIDGGMIIFERHKTGVETIVPLTHELRAVIARTPDIAPAFVLTSRGKPYSKESLGNIFRDAAAAAGVNFRLHGLRKAFCVYWAEQGRSTHQIATMAGHLTLKEVERYTRDADRKRMIQLLVESS